MDKFTIRVRGAPATFLGKENEDLISPLVYFVLIVSIFSYRAMSHGGMKLKFIKENEESFKKPPSQQRRKEE